MEAATTITQAITSLAGTVATDAVGMLTTIVPALAPIVGAGIVARLGLRFVKRFSN